MMMPTLALSQVRVKNSGTEKVDLVSVDQTKAIAIEPGETVFVSWLPSRGTAQYRLNVYNGSTAKLSDVMTVEVSSTILSVNGSANSSEVASFNSRAATNKKIEGPQEAFKSPISTSAGSVLMTTLSVIDSTSFRISIPTGPFAGVSLKSGQHSSQTANVKLGECTFPLYYDSEPDSISSGLRYKWAVISKIIVEGQKTLVIKDEDLQEAFNSAIIKKSLKSNLPFNFLITDELNSGVVVAASSTSDKLSLHPGWNFITIQYKDENGWPTQAVLVLLVSESDRLMAGKKTGGENLTIEKENIIFTTR